MYMYLYTTSVVAWYIHVIGCSLYVGVYVDLDIPASALTVFAWLNGIIRCYARASNSSSHMIVYTTCE